jgi:DNA invertase Pin-like site-specific DNA recombinase
LFRNGHRQQSPTALIGASYARYSSDLQDDSSIPDQRQCRERAATLPIEIDPACEYSDQAVSGTRRDRAGLTRLLHDAEARRFQVLFFFSLSRLARESVISMPLLKELVHVHRVRVISVTEGIDSQREGWETRRC